MDKINFIDLRGKISATLGLIKMKNWLPQPRTIKYDLSVVNGKLSLDSVVQDGEIVNYIVDGDFAMHFGKGCFHMGLKACDVVMAGVTKIRGGKICYINNDSDHFEPEYEKFVEFVKQIRKLSFVSNELLVEFYDFKTKTTQKIDFKMKVTEMWKPNIETDKKSIGPSDNWFIFLHNDCVNSKKDVTIVLFNNTKLPYADCERIMNCAHLNSSALICQGPYPEIEYLQEILENAGLKISISLITDVSSSN
jgi:ATP-dependent Clp protease adapter protein ClpS